MEKCILCLSDTFIPVQVKCFQCYHSYHIHCNSFHRICLFCFLQKKITKCFFCQSEEKENIYPKFEIDYDRIRADTFSIYTCPICQNFKGRHSDVCKHVLQNHIYQCKCGDIIQNDEISIIHHKKTCTLCEYCLKCKKNSNSCPCLDNKFISCKICNAVLSKKNFMNHSIEHIQQSKTKVEILRGMLNDERRRYHSLLEKIEEDYDTL